EAGVGVGVLDTGDGLLLLDADGDAPGEVALGAEGFLVEEVAPAPYSLGDCQAGHDDVGPLVEGEGVAAAIEDEGNNAADDCALDAEAAFPDFEPVGDVLVA